MINVGEPRSDRLVIFGSLPSVVDLTHLTPLRTPIYQCTWTMDVVQCQTGMMSSILTPINPPANGRSYAFIEHSAARISLRLASPTVCGHSSLWQTGSHSYDFTSLVHAFHRSHLAPSPHSRASCIWLAVPLRFPLPPLPRPGLGSPCQPHGRKVRYELCICAHRYAEDCRLECSSVYHEDSVRSIDRTAPAWLHRRWDHR